jgi:regulator of sigma E protease
MSILITVIIFSILIVSHEYGHYIAARRSGVRVEKFSIGFGPPIIKIKGKETQFLICLIPLGGYVKLAGDERSQCKGEPFEFFSKPLGVRAKIVFFGSFFNIILAFLVFWISFTIFGFPSSKPIVGQVRKHKAVPEAKFSPKQLIQLRENNIIKKADNDQKYALWPASELEKQELQSAGFSDKASDNLLAIWDKASRLALKSEFNPQDLKELTKRYLVIEKMVYWDTEGEEGLEAKLSQAPVSGKNKVLAILKESRLPAYRSGMENDDRILKVNQEPVNSWTEMSELIRQSQGPIQLEILRGQDKKNIEIIPERLWVKTLEGEKEVSQIGITSETVKANVVVSFAKALGKVYDMSKEILQGFHSLITRKISFKESVAGPIGIVFFTTKIAKFGIYPLLEFLGYLSMVLAIINLFPFPVLDGGHLFFMLIEKLKKGPIPQNWENRITQGGLAALVSLMLFVGYNDFKRFIFKKPSFNQEQFDVLKTKGIIDELGDERGYVFWAVADQEDLVSKLSEIENLDQEKTLSIWENSQRMTKVVVK